MRRLWLIVTLPLTITLAIFAVANRESLIKSEFREELYKYITGIVRNQGQKLIAIGGMPDHVHILIGLKPVAALADVVREIKADSTNFINNWIVHGLASNSSSGVQMIGALNPLPLHTVSITGRITAARARKVSGPF